MYCNRVFTVINADISPEKKVLANKATQIYGLAGFFAIVVSPVIISRFKKRITILKVGQLAIFALVFGLAMSISYFKNGFMAVCFVIMFQPAYCWSIGNLHWPFISETTSDIQFGFVSFFHYLNSILISVITEYQLNSWGPANMFLFYSAMSLGGYFFVITCLRETHGLTDKEKKQLYQPKTCEDDYQTIN